MLCHLFGCRPCEPYAVCDRCGRVGDARANPDGLEPLEGLFPWLARCLRRCVTPPARATCRNCGKALGRRRFTGQFCSAECLERYFPF